MTLLAQTTIENVLVWLLTAAGVGLVFVGAKFIRGRWAFGGLRVREALDRLDAVTEDLAFAVVGVDGSIVDASRELLLLLDATSSAMTAIEDLDARLHPDDRETWLRVAQARRERTVGTIEFQCRLRRAGGSWAWLHVVQRPVGERPEPELYMLRFVDFSLQRAAEDRAARLSEIEKAKSLVLAMLAAPADSGAALRRAIETAARALRAERAAFCAVNAAEGRASFEFEWIDPHATGVSSVLAQRQLLPPHAVVWWLDAFSAGKPVVLTRDAATMADPVRAARLPPDAQSMLVIPCFALGHVRGAITIEFLRAPARVQSDEMSLATVLAFAAARVIERGDCEREQRARGLAERRLARTELFTQLGAAVEGELRDALFALSASPNDRAGLDTTVARATHAVRDIVLALAEATTTDDDDELTVDAATAIDDAARVARRLLPREFTLTVTNDVARGVRLPLSRGDVRRIVVALLAAARESAGRAGSAHLVAAVETSDALDRHAARLVLHVDDSGAPPTDTRRPHVLAETLEEPSREGLLLAVARRMLDDADGTLEITVAPASGGRRATARVTLSDDDAQAPSAPRRADALHDRLPDVGRAIVVDADPEVRSVLAQALEALDIEVHAFADASDADRAILDGPLRYELLVLDIDLPEAEGIACLERLRDRGSLIPTIVTTDGRTDVHSALAPLRILRKPFPLEALLREARGVIDDARAWRRMKE